MPVNPVEARKWAAESKQPATLTSKLLFVWHQVVPSLRLNVSIKQFILAVVKFLAVVVIASSPFWIEYFQKNTMQIKDVALFTVPILLAMVYLYFYERSVLSDSSDISRHEELVSLRQTKAINELNNVVRVNRGNSNKDKIDSIVKSLIGCIDQGTRSYLRQYKESYFQVTLMLFTDNTGTSFNIAHRAYPTRREGVVVASSGAAAFYVAETNSLSKAIHDLKNQSVFPYAGLSASAEPPYRSVLLLPVTLSKRNGDTICLGVISIDASRPYEFWGTREYDLAVRLQPYVQLIGLLLDDGQFGIKV